MEGPKLTLLMGGLEEQKNRQLAFVDAHVTDTRLMGVLYMYVRWVDESGEYINMFFYLDVEETGFEVYRSLRTSLSSMVLDVESEMAGGLGGRMIDLTEKEARAILQEYARFNIEHGLPLPDGRDEYGFMLEPVVLTKEEKEILLEKQCVKIGSEYQLIHYFLMRCFGHDYDMAGRLSEDNVILETYDEYEKASYYRNSIMNSGEGTYYCESLIESGNQYYILVSEIAVDEGKVSFFENCSKMAISATEAAMILARSEYINCYEILTGPDMFEELLKEITHNAMMTRHENGELYMVYNENNDHVDGPVFQMNEDVFGVYYVTKYGQLIMSSYEEDRINEMHGKLRENKIGSFLAAAGRYEFKDPVLYDFIRSDFDDFDEFLDYLHD